MVGAGYGVGVRNVIIGANGHDGTLLNITFTTKSAAVL